MSGGKRAAVLLCLVGGSLLLGSAGRSWVTVAAQAAPPLPAGVERLTGGDLTAVRAAGVVALAAAAALALARPLARLLVGAFLLLLALVAAAGPLAVVQSPSRAAERNGLAGSAAASAWPWLAVAGAACLLAAGVLALLGVRRWVEPVRRHEREAEPTDLWTALDAGHDPTASAPDADRSTDRGDPRGAGREGGPTLPS